MLLPVHTVDLHQHLWPEGVLRALETRSSAPRARPRGATWRIDLPGEPSFEVDARDHDPNSRVAGLNTDRAIAALSSPVGIEGLPERDALAAVAAWQEAAESLPDALGWWAAAPAALPVTEQASIVTEAIANGAAGLCLPANRLASPAAAEQAIGLLEAVAQANAPVFVHPGPAADNVAGTTQPDWWSPSTDYVAQQHIAWHAFHHAIRPQIPHLRVVFALLAGLAPLHAERTQHKGGPRREQTGRDPLAFYDVSTYGPDAIRSMAAAVGIGQLVHGTDFPVGPAVDDDPVATAFCPEMADVTRRDAPARALGYTWVPA